MTRLTQSYIDKIQNLLQQIEKDKDIKIIFAIENGSRSWGIYYYYYPDFDPLKYKKPDEVQYTENNFYTIFIYNENHLSSVFETYPVYNEKGAMVDSMFIKDEPGFMFDMIINGINLKPQYYVQGKKGCDGNNYNGDCTDICKFSDIKNKNLQIKYTVNPQEGNIVKQMEFDNGPVSLGNICNPDWVPGMDI